MALKKKAPETVVFHGTTTGAWAVPKTRKSTNEQREVIGTAGNLVTVTAYAGTGKTTTLHEFARARHSEKMLYLVFNRSMAEDAKRAFKDCANVSISTIHALAFRFYGRDYQRKLGNIRPHDLRRYLQKRNMPHSYEAVSSLFHIVQTFLMSADADPAATVARLKPDRRREIAERGLDAQKLVDAATEVWADIRAQELPMPHNGYLKMLQLNPVPLNVDRILVDEAQDISDCVIDIVAGSGKKLLLVGDPYQQIYGWNGAVDALAKMSGNGATSYYLTQSFRCPNDVAGAADVYLQALNAPKTFRGAPQLLPPQGPEAVIARTNLGLFDEIVSANPAKTNIYYTGGFESYEYRSLVDIYRLKNNERHKVRDTFIGSFEEF
ncbi:MAG: UvrD-helicase domain-containing protein, partial [Desulfovibrio sp.]|nr:UvrD-helicase domain-containing protein [Desulfovibrio sp.]